MNHNSEPAWKDAFFRGAKDDVILSYRGPKNALDPERPYAYLIEPEVTRDGVVEDVATVFLTNRECPFRCLMCDLWQNTLDQPTRPGAIVAQIDYALSRLPPSDHIKLYNSGNFFDAKAIPSSDHQAIAGRVAGFKSVIVENHPRLCGDACLRFRDAVGGRLDVAMGLETTHPDVLARLNKQMTLDDFARAAEWLKQHDIEVRAFILLRPPFLDEDEGLTWAIHSLEFAFAAGVECCAVIPTRAGNGIMEHLATLGHFAPPTLRSLEQAHEAGLRMERGRVLVDLWDIDRLASCPQCGAARRERLARMNLAQKILPAVDCECQV